MLEQNVEFLEVQARTIRADVDSEDLLRAVSGICMANDARGWSERAARLVDLLMDGLRYGAAEPSPASSARTEAGTSRPRRKSGAGRASA